MNRITIVETLYHQADGTPPTSFSSNFARMLESDEAPYSRPKIKATEEWTEVDLGWLKGVAGVVKIANLGGARTGRGNPSEEEKTLINSRVLEVVLGTSTVNSAVGWEVPVGEDMRGQLPSGASLRVRCKGGETTFSFTAFPR